MSTDQTERFFTTIAKINSFQSLSIFKDRWLRITKQPWYDQFSLEDKLELNKIKETKKAELLKQSEKEKEIREDEMLQWKESKEGKIIMEYPQVYSQWIQINAELDRRQEIESLTKLNQQTGDNKQAIIFDMIKTATELGIENFTPNPILVEIPNPTMTESTEKLIEMKQKIKKFFRFKGVEIDT